jgi:hypothetical protein
MKMKKYRFQRENSAEKGIYALFRLKIRTWASMPLKGHIIAGFRLLTRDCSLPVKALLVLSGKRTAGSLPGERQNFPLIFPYRA